MIGQSKTVGMCPILTGCPQPVKYDHSADVVELGNTQPVSKDQSELLW